MSLRIALLGATGGCGKEFTKQALEKGHFLCLLVRSGSEGKLDESVRNHSSVKVWIGDATNARDVKEVTADAEVVVSCLGNVSASPPFIMSLAFRNILDACATIARRTGDKKKPRCFFVTSVGIGGTSSIVKFVLGFFAGKESLADYDAAETQVLEHIALGLADDGNNEETEGVAWVPCLVIRPPALTNGPLTDKKFSIIEHDGISRMVPRVGPRISRANVARFLIDCLEDEQWDNSKFGIDVGMA